VSSAAILAPESSAFGMNPRAPLEATSEPKSELSRLETMMTAGPSPFAVSSADFEAVHVGQLYVEQDDVRAEFRDCGERCDPVLRDAHDVETVGLQQHPRAGPEARVIVDDQDCHVRPLVGEERRERDTVDRSIASWTCIPSTPLQTPNLCVGAAGFAPVETGPDRTKELPAAAQPARTGARSEVTISTTPTVSG
jgi:hypothetical protein